MQLSSKPDEENPLFQESGLNSAIETDKNGPNKLSSSDQVDSLGSSKKSLMFNKVSVLPHKKDHLKSIILKKFSSLVPSHDFTDSVNEMIGSNQFLVWIAYYFLYADCDDDALRLIYQFLILQGSKLDQSSSLPFPEIKACLQKEFNPDNSLNVTKLFEFFYETPEFYRFFFSKTLRKLQLNPSIISPEFVKRVIADERRDFLNEILHFKAEESLNPVEVCPPKGENKFYSWFQELVNHEVQKESNTNKQEIVCHLLSSCIQEKQEHLLKLCLDFARKLAKNLNLTVEAIENECFGYVFQCLKISRKYSLILVKDQVFLALVQAMSRVSAFETAVLLIFAAKGHFRELNNLHLKVLLDRFQHFVQEEWMRKLSFSLNPAGLAIVIAEILRLLSTKKPQFQMKMQALAKSLLEFALIFLHEINEISLLHEILCKPIMKPSSESILDIVISSPLFYEEILSADFMVTIVRMNLSEGYQFDYNFLVGSTAFHYLTNGFGLRHKPGNRIENENTPISASKTGIQGGHSVQTGRTLDINVFNYIRKSEENVIASNNHVHSFLIFTRNINIRLFMDFLYFFGLLLLIYYEIYTASSLSSIVSNMSQDIRVYLSFMTLPAQYKDLIISNLQNLDSSEKATNFLYKKYILKDPSTVNYVNKFTISGDFQAYSSCYKLIVGLTHTQEMSVYMNDCMDAGEALKLFSDDITTLIVVIGLVAIFCGQTYLSRIYMRLTRARASLISSRDLVFELSLFTDLTLLYLLSRLQNQNSGFTIDTRINDMRTINILLNIQLLLLMLIFFFYLSYIDRFGRLVHLIYLVSMKLVPYFIVLMFMVFYVALAFNVIFSEYFLEFETFFESLKIMAEGFLGAFIFLDDEDGTAIIAYFGMLSVYLLLCNAVFLNLVIAVLNNTYIKFSEIGKIFVSLQSYSLRQTHGFHRLYSGMISFPTAFNLCGMFFGGILVYFRTKEANERVLKFAYFLFMFLPTSLAFIISHIVIIPLSYVKIISLIIINHYKTYDGFRYKVPKVHSFLHIISWLFLGIPYLFWIFLFNDLSQFIHSCFLETDNRLKIQPTFKTDWKVLKLLVSEFSEEGKAKVSANEFADKLIEKYKEMDLEKTVETAGVLRRIPKGEVFPNDEFVILDEAPKKATTALEDAKSSLEKFKQRYKAERLFQRFVVKESVDIEKMKVILERLQRLSKKRRRNAEKTKKSLVWINIVNLKEFENALRKWRGPEVEEEQILESVEYGESES